MIQGPGYGGLIKPKHLQHIKVPNRGFLSIESGDTDTKVPQAQGGKRVPYKKTVFKRKRASDASETKRPDHHSQQNTEQDEANLKQELWEGI
jgi:hypothetical protein